MSRMLASMLVLVGSMVAAGAQPPKAMVLRDCELSAFLSVVRLRGAQLY